jgi:O-antigen ligase
MALNVPVLSLPPVTHKLDRMLILIPTAVCAYPALISPLVIYMTADANAVQLTSEVNSRIENKFFWPLLMLVTLSLSWTRLAYLRNIRAPAGLLFLGMYIALAAFSALWSVEPDTSVRRVILEIMVLVSIVVPIAISEKRDRVFSDLFICFAAVAVVNLVFVITHPPTPIGHAGYYDHKNSLGLHVAISYILAIYELFKGRMLRRAFAAFVAVISLLILVVSQSKTSLGLAVLSPFLGIAAAMLVRRTGISPAWLVFYFLSLFALAFFIGLDTLGLSFDDVSFLLFGDDTFTGRTTIWAFALEMAEQRPAFGWGYQAFWGDSLDAPARLGPGWVADMPSGHNGYLDTLLETGFIGLTLLLSMIVSALNASRVVAERSPRNGALILSLVLFAIIHNGLETSFLWGAGTLWIVFAIILTFVSGAAGERQQALSTRSDRLRITSLQLSCSARAEH